MICRDYEARLEDLLDEQLDPAALKDVAIHLAGCPACREAVEAAQRSRKLLHALEPVGEPGAEFWPRVEASIRGQMEKQHHFWRPLEVLAWRLSWSAGLALVLLGAYLATSALFRHEGQKPQETEIREIFPDPVRQPADRDEVLLTLAENGHGR